MLAVAPAYRNTRLGYRLKLAQRERVLSQGLTCMTWTFDPLQSLNANFNLAKLGVLSRTYKINIYGEATSSFLHRNGTDRLFVEWLLDSPRVVNRIERHDTPTASQELISRATPLVRVASDDAPLRISHKDAFTDSHALIEIPADINLMQRERAELAMQWREATRAAFTDALAAGYVVCEFQPPARDVRPFGTYLLGRGNLEAFSS
jgi:predicted GNAT superfamily acetyltransferase